MSDPDGRTFRPCFSLRRSLTHLNPPKRASPVTLQPAHFAIAPCGATLGTMKADSSAPSRNSTDQTFTDWIMYFSTHAPNGPRNPRCRSAAEATSGSRGVGPRSQSGWLRRSLTILPSFITRRTLSVFSSERMSRIGSVFAMTISASLPA